jgi:hypothetical protein
MTRANRLLAFAAGAFLLLGGFPVAAQQPANPPTPSPGPKSIAGVVTGPAGPEAGVWVVAETTELPTRFARIVVTDDRGPKPDNQSD